MNRAVVFNNKKKLIAKTPFKNKKQRIKELKKLKEILINKLHKRTDDVAKVELWDIGTPVAPIGNHGDSFIRL